MLKRLLFFCFLICTVAGLSAQQTKTVSGVVKDAETGEELIGVSIIEPGGTNGTMTSLDGTYTLQVTGTKLVFSYIGYSSQEITITASQTLDVALKSDTKLDEVVVVGYGVQKKSDLTGSVSSISSKDIQNYAVPNVSQLLTGKAAGVFVAATSGQPGADAVVRIRGFGTVNDNNPLYVVDGQFMDNMNSINPSDVENIEVLKDASAAAIYGSRGSNGVILVTTKRGAAGKTVVNLDAYIGVKKSYKAMKMANSEQYYNYITEAYKGQYGWGAGGENQIKFDELYKRGYNTNWWDEATQTAFTQNYNLSILKGSDSMTSSFSLGYLGDEGTIVTTKYDRLTLRLNNEYKLNDIVKIGGTVGLTKSKTVDAGALKTFDLIQKADPFTPVINPLVDPSSENYEYNKYAPTDWSFDQNPIALLNLPTRGTDAFNVYGNLFADVKILKGLTYRFQYSFERNNDKSKNFMPFYYSTYSPYTLNDNSGGKENLRTRLSNGTRTLWNQTFENRLNYYFEKDKHSFDAMLATTFEDSDIEWFDAYKEGALGNSSSYHVLDAQTANAAASGSRTTTSMLSFLGRVNYSYDDKYLATVNFRADGSSKFAKDNRWGYFPSFSLGWKIANEDFYKTSFLSTYMNNLKLRAGWGRNGNQRIDQNAALSLIGTSPENQWWFGNSLTQGYVPSYMGNKAIKWETSEQTNVGVDMAFLNNKLQVSADYYLKKTRDMLLQSPIPSFVGYPNAPWDNAGDLKNTGFEFVASYRDRTGDFDYNFGLNMSTYKTKVTNLNDQMLTTGVSRTEVGGPIGRFYGFKHIGIFQNQEQINNHSVNGKLIQPDAKPGDFIFADLDGNGELNDADRTYIGDPNPDLIYGFNIGLAYKNFDLSMAFQGTLGNDIWNTSRGSLTSPGRNNVLAAAYTQAWTKEGDKATYPRIQLNDDNKNFRASSFFVEDGSFLRLQNIQLGYTIPTSLAAKSKVFSSCRVYVSAQNLFTITSYSGLDPELGVNNPLEMGVDNTRYPAARTMTFGVNLQF